MTADGLWPLRRVNVVCSGLRAKRFAQVHGRAFLYRVFFVDGRRWKTTRVRIRSVNDPREDGEEVEITIERPYTRTRAELAIESDFKKLQRFGLQQQGELTP